MYDYEKRVAQQKRYERMLDIIIWCAMLGVVGWVVWRWFC